jgi:hypothetical protein
MNILRHMTVQIVRKTKKYSDDTVDDENEDVVIPEIMPSAIKGEAEFAFLGEEEIKPPQKKSNQ